MVNEIKFNPYTGKVFTAEEIKILDTNNDGIISAEELNANIAFLQSNDDEGSVQIGNGTDKGNSCALITEDMKNTAIEKSKVQERAFGSRIKNSALGKIFGKKAEKGPRLVLSTMQKTSLTSLLNH